MTSNLIAKVEALKELMLLADEIESEIQMLRQSILEETELRGTKELTANSQPLHRITRT